MNVKLTRNFSITILNVLCIAAVIYLVNNEVVVDPIEAVELAVAVEASENSIELVTEITDVQERLNWCNTG